MKQTLQASQNNWLRKCLLETAILLSSLIIYMTYVLRVLCSRGKMDARRPRTSDFVVKDEVQAYKVKKPGSEERESSGPFPLQN